MSSPLFILERTSTLSMLFSPHLFLSGRSRKRTLVKRGSFRRHPFHKAPSAQADEPGPPVNNLRRWIKDHCPGTRARSVEHRHQLFGGSPARLPAVLARSIEPEVHLCLVLAAEDGQEATTIEREHLDAVCAVLRDQPPRGPQRAARPLVRSSVQHVRSLSTLPPPDPPFLGGRLVRYRRLVVILYTPN